MNLEGLLISRRSVFSWMQSCACQCQKCSFHGFPPPAIRSERLFSAKTMGAVAMWGANFVDRSLCRFGLFACSVALKDVTMLLINDQNYLFCRCARSPECADLVSFQNYSQAGWEHIATNGAFIKGSELQSSTWLHKRIPGGERACSLTRVCQTENCVWLERIKAWRLLCVGDCSDCSNYSTWPADIGLTRTGLTGNVSLVQRNQIFFVFPANNHQ